MKIDAHIVTEALKAAIPKLAFDLRPDVLCALRKAHDAEKHERGKLVLHQLCENAAIAAKDRVPICQDTGTVWLCLELGTNCELAQNPFAHVNETVACSYKENALRMSTLRDALLDRTNAGTNTPAFSDIKFVDAPGATLHVMLKGGGSDNASCVEMLAPSAGWEGIKQVVVERVKLKAANACPPLVIGVGVGATFDKVAALSKHALLRPLDVPNKNKELAKYEEELLLEINALGIGAAALGGAASALACHIETAPCHIAALPVAVNMGCCAMRSISINLEEFAKTGRLL